MRECQEQARLDMKRTLSNASGNGRQTSASFDEVNGGVSDPKASLSIRQVGQRDIHGSNVIFFPTASVVGDGIRIQRELSDIYVDESMSIPGPRCGRCG